MPEIASDPEIIADVRSAIAALPAAARPPFRGIEVLIVAPGELRGCWALGPSAAHEAIGRAAVLVDAAALRVAFEDDRLGLRLALEQELRRLARRELAQAQQAFPAGSCAHCDAA